MYCISCGNKMSAEERFCIHCGKPVELTQTGITPRKIDIRYRKTRIFLWFVLTNLCVVISLALISGGALLNMTPYLLIIGSTFPFYGLFFSRWLAKRTHSLYIIDPKSFQSTDEKNLYAMITELSKASGITSIPEIGIYNSTEQNAFATGWRKNKALLAFSTGLLSSLDKSEIYAVAAHEIAHIVNGDMIIMTIIQSIINTFVLIITLPFNLLKLFAFLSDEVGVFGYWAISAIKGLVSVVALFLGNMIMNVFSRNREFKADKLAAEFIGKRYMISALRKLDTTEIMQTPKEQMAYAAFKINGAKRLLDIFSTHPSIERRIERLRNC